MRRAFTEQLAELEDRILTLLRDAANTMATVAGAVESASDERVSALARDADRLREGARRVHVELVALVGTQTPVAGDLRVVVALIELAHHAALIGNQFELISRQLADVDPHAVERHGIRDRLSEMSALGSSQLRKAATAFHTRDLRQARELDADDDQVDRINREIFDTVTRAQSGADPSGLEFRYVLIARCLERIGDNAVDIGEQAAFVLTAERLEFSDASRPRPRGRS
jgi:phosphate transport system protein